MNLADYVERCRDLTGFWGSWPPSYPIEVGLIGTRDKDQRLRRIKTLDAIPEVSSPKIVRTKTNVNESFYDKSNTEVTARATAAASGGGHSASSAVTVSFKRQSGLLLAYAGATYTQVEDIDLLKRQILALAQNKIWEPDWIAVVETVQAKHVTVIASAGKKAKMVFDIKTDAASFGAWQLARADLGLSVQSRSSIGLESIAKSGTPLYRTITLKKDWRRRLKAELVGESPVDDDAFVDIPWFGMADDV
jgi:hypothetical protein